MIKVDIFSGFLGAGKTTLIRKMIKEGYEGEKLVLIENEFGDIGIDGGFLKEAGIEIKEMNSGCICCSLVGDFKESIGRVITEFAPDRILIEPSGVGKLSDVMKAVADSSEEIEIEGTVAVVDAKKGPMYIKNFGEFFNDQIKYANTVILSHTQTLSEEKVTKIVDMIHEINEECTVVTTDWEKLSGAQIHEAMKKEDALGNMIKEMHEHHHEHHHDHHDHDDHCCCGHDHHGHHEHHHDHDEHCCCGHDHHDHHEHHHDHHDHDDHCCCGHDHHGHHHADEVFSTWGCETAKAFDPQALNDILEQFEDEKTYGFVLRAKGVVEGTDGKWIHFDYIPGEADVRTGMDAEVTGRICVIGTEINEANIKELFLNK